MIRIFLCLITLCFASFTSKAQLASKLAIPNAFATQEPGKNYATILDIGENALIARIHLIRAAKKSIKIQTFIWDNDDTGIAVAREVISAAERGVKVQVIIDQMCSYQNPKVFAWILKNIPNIEVKIYAPVGKRLAITPLSTIKQVLDDYSVVNMRMHNKSLTVDERYTIVGGRNIDNHYYDQSLQFNFRDRDVLIAGPVASQVARFFDHYWKSNTSLRAERFTDVKAMLGGDEKIAIDSKEIDDYGLLNYIKKIAYNTAAVRRLIAAKKRYYPVEHAEYWSDLPGKMLANDPNGSGLLTKKLLKQIALAKTEIVAQNSYLIFGQDTLAILRQIKEQNPQLSVIVSTNSLASLDSSMVYGLYYQLNDTYIDELGLKIYEYKPIPANIREVMPNYPRLLQRKLTPREQKRGLSSYIFNSTTQSPREYGRDDNTLAVKSHRKLRSAFPLLSIHAKSYVFDSKIAIIGSYNLDPRSAKLNTENAIAISDVRFARDLKRLILRDTEPGNSWVLWKNNSSPFVKTLNRFFNYVSEHSPLSIYPFRGYSCFTLRTGHKQVPIGAKDFYTHYKDVGLFPMFNPLSYQVIGARLTKTIGKHVRHIF